jgi:phospholipid-binding lipoprotein MlaA
MMIANAFDNLTVVPRVVNNLLQGKWNGAGREVSRFLINSTAGVGGLFDPAKDVWHITKSPADFGQTLGKWGIGPGPYSFSRSWSLPGRACPIRRLLAPAD